ncbi:MAG: YdcF family protein [Gemmatimonadaceae bacterium]
MPPTHTSNPRTAARRAKPALVRDFTSGAILGALVWLAVTTLEINSSLHLSIASGLLPAAVLGGLLGVTRYRVILWLAGGALAALFAVVAFTPIIVQPAQALVRSDPMPSPPLTLDAVVVLSGDVTTDGLIGYSGIERLLSGIRLARSTGTQSLVTTRVRHPANLEISSDADQKRLVQLMGPGMRLFIVPDVFSTRDEALRVRELAAQRGWARVAVVTSPSHSRRACGAFEKVGLRVTCIPAESRDVAFRTLDLPTDRVKAFRLWIYEIAGTVNYRLNGWLP